MKSQYFHNRMVNDLRKTCKKYHLPERQDKNIRMSYTRLLYHIVFRTKNSKHTIPEQHENELYAYIMGIINNKRVNCIVLVVFVTTFIN